MIDRIQAAGIAEVEAERITLDFIKTYVKSVSAPLCGNSIGQVIAFPVNNA